MKNWLRSDLSGYIEKNKTGSDLFVFQHIPKTAGSSIVQEMSRHIGAYEGVFIDYSNLPAVGGVDDLMMVSLDRFLTSYHPARVKCISGHLRRKHINRIAEVLPEAKFSTFLRDPVDRVISDYRYQCTDQHPPYLEFRKKYPSIEDYIAVRGAGNKMWHFLVDKNVPVDEGIAMVEDYYTFIGIKEFYDVSINIMMMLNGADAMPKLHVRPTKNIEQNRVEVSDSLRNQILEANQKDHALYEYFHSLLLAKVDSWREIRKAKSQKTLEQIHGSGRPTQVGSQPMTQSERTV